MKLLGGTSYDFLTARVTKATSSLLAMTAYDTTNLRATFVAPSTGNVYVTLNGGVMGGSGSNAAQVLLGVLDGATIKGRQAPLVGSLKAASSNTGCRASFVVTGLTPGTTYNWDLAYGVELTVASTVFSYGGLDDNIASNGYGCASILVWDAPGLLGGVLYDPGTAVATSAAAAVAMTALDTTNLRLTFTCPSSGKVMVRMRGVVSGTTASSQGGQLWGVLDGATVRGRVLGLGGVNQVANSPLATDQRVYDGSFLVTGLTPGTSYTWDAAYSVEIAQTSASIKYGGPDNTTQDDAWGGFAYEIWNVDSVPRAIGSVA